jgi:hypothetical protein
MNNKIMKNKHSTRKRKAQSFLDYSALIALIIFALLAMSGYVMKSVNARFAHVWADLYHPINGVR